jgi:O-glycosyl hydrolase
MKRKKMMLAKFYLLPSQMLEGTEQTLEVLEEDRHSCRNFNVGNLEYEATEPLSLDLEFLSQYGKLKIQKHSINGDKVVVASDKPWSSPARLKENRC